MGFVREDIKTARNEEEENELLALYERYLQCDVWAKRALIPMGILLTSHPNNRAYLKASVETHKKLGLWLTVAYDNHFEPERPNVTSNDILPARDVFDMIDCFVMSHNQSWGGVLYPYFWLLKFGLSAMADFEYVWCANGDCILEKPEGFPQLIDMLGDSDIMGVGWEGSEERPIFNTTAFLAKTKAARAIMKHFQDHFTPFEMFEKYTQEFGNCEGRFGRAIKDLGLKEVRVEKNPFNTQLHVKGGTFYDVVGFRHIHAEHSYAYQHREIPPEVKWFDERFIGDEFKRIKAYWETKDISILENEWWAKE